VIGPVPAAGLRALADEYLAFRRRLGFELDKPGFLVRRFAEYCDGSGITQVTVQAVLDWVLLAGQPASPYRWLRLNAAGSPSTCTPWTPLIRSRRRTWFPAGVTGPRRAS
jgi:hypothetical protein